MKRRTSTRRKTMLAIGRTHLATDFNQGPSNNAKVIREALDTKFIDDARKRMNNMFFMSAITVTVVMTFAATWNLDKFLLSQ